MTASRTSYFERRAGGYLDASRKGLWGLARSAEWRAIRERLALAPGLDVLDAGCGPGYYSLRMRETQDVRTLGIDASRSMMAAYRGQGFEGELSTLEAFKTARRFDRILIAGVLEFVEDPETAMKNLAGLLKTKGKIVCLIPDAGAAGRAYQLVHRMRGCPTSIRTPLWYFHLAQRCGLSAAEFVEATPISSVFSLRPWERG
jgi:2-polyprenyl-3-methyl-5-hydroxy-6-metoxy-1,4-benzoquinol methylase